VSIQPVVAVGGRVVCRSEVGRIILGLTVWYVGAYAPAILIWGIILELTVRYAAAYAPAYQTVNSHGHRHKVTATTGCIDTICLS